MHSVKIFLNDKSLVLKRNKYYLLTYLPGFPDQLVFSLRPGHTCMIRVNRGMVNAPSTGQPLQCGELKV